MARRSAHASRALVSVLVTENQYQLLATFSF